MKTEETMKLRETIEKIKYEKGWETQKDFATALKLTQSQAHDLENISTSTRSHWEKHWQLFLRILLPLCIELNLLPKEVRLAWDMRIFKILKKSLPEKEYDRLEKIIREDIEGTAVQIEDKEAAFKGEHATIGLHRKESPRHAKEGKIKGRPKA